MIQIKKEVKNYTLKHLDVKHVLEKLVSGGQLITEGEKETEIKLI